MDGKHLRREKDKGGQRRSQMITARYQDSTYPGRKSSLPISPGDPCAVWRIQGALLQINPRHPQRDAAQQLIGNGADERGMRRGGPAPGAASSGAEGGQPKAPGSGEGNGASRAAQRGATHAIRGGRRTTPPTQTTRRPTRSPRADRRRPEEMRAGATHTTTHSTPKGHGPERAPGGARPPGRQATGRQPNDNHKTSRGGEPGAPPLECQQQAIAPLHDQAR